MRALLALGIALALLVCSGVPVSADSFTWGYTALRQRATTALVGQEAADAQALGGAPARPFVVPLPGRSQSTPVVVNGRWYQWTYWDGGREGALWTGLLAAAGATSTAGTPVTLPGQGGPVVTASGAAGFAYPDDAAISPDGRWVAFGAGADLYWWPAGDPAAGAFAAVTGPSHAAAYSTSPTFVPDAAAASGWEVCDGNWDGGFACFAVSRGDGFAPVPLARYLVTMTTPADGDGYTAITSSAAYGGPLRALYFGVASAHDPRVVELDPRTGGFFVLDGGGRVQAPIWAAVALDGTAVYATDVNGSAYLFDARSGNLVHDFIAASPVPNIVSPAVGGNHLYLVLGAYGVIMRLNRYTLQYADFVPAPVGGVTQASALTLVRAPGVATEVFYATLDGGVRIAAPGPAPQAGPPGRSTLYAIGGWPGAPAGGAYNWTAAVVDGGDVLLWSDGATAAWGADAPEAAAPAGFGPAGGGMQIYRLVPRLTALLEPASVTAGGGMVRLYLLAAPGAAVSLGGAVAGSVAALPDASAAVPCPAGLAGREGADFGVFPQRGAPSVGPPGGCGPLSQQVGPVTRYAQAHAGGAHPAFSGLLPSAWQAAGAGYAAWLALLPAPATEGAFPLTVTATLPGGARSTVRLWLLTSCPAGWAAGAGGRCTTDVRPAPNAWGDGPPPPGDECPPGVAPGVGGMTTAEFALLCRPLTPWLTDASVIACYGSWWNWINRRYVEKGCVTPGYGTFAGP